MLDEWYSTTGWLSEYAYLNGQLIAQYRNNTTYSVFADHLGSTRLLTGMDKAPVQNLDYYPYGSFNSSNSAITTHDFTGKERDSESGLDNFGARYFTSNLGRFTSPDEFWKDSHVADPQSWNKYAYVRNNPLRYMDCNGEEATATQTCNADSGGHKTCNVSVTATIAIYSVNGTTTEQLQQAQSAITEQIDQAWSGSFAQGDTTYNVTTAVSVSIVGSEQQGIDAHAQNVIGIDSSGKSQSKIEAGSRGYDKGVFDFAQIKSGGMVSHEFAHIVGLDDNHGNVISNSIRPAINPNMKATPLDFQWALGPELTAGQRNFRVGQREGLNWLTGNNRGNRKWWEGYTSRSTNE